MPLALWDAKEKKIIRIYVLTQQINVIWQIEISIYFLYHKLS